MYVRANSGFETALETLKSAGDLRVWSLIVTVFGDLASGEDDALTGRALANVLEPIGVKPEAVRVALHRLRKDGWIVSERMGQTRRHSLSAAGRAESVAARAAIYDEPRSDEWRIALLPTDADLARRAALGAAGWTPLGAGALIAFGAAGAPGDDALVAGSRTARLPAWVVAELEPADLAAGFAELEAALSNVEEALGSRPALSERERASLRTLIVHRWRRLALKDSGAPDAAHRSDWRGPACRRLTHDLLSRIPAPRAHELE